MTSATSLAKSRPIRPILGGDGVARRLLRPVGAFGALCVAIIRMARDLEAASTDQERRQIAQRDINPRRAA